MASYVSASPSFTRAHQLAPATQNISTYGHPGDKYAVCFAIFFITAYLGFVYLFCPEDSGDDPFAEERSMFSYSDSDSDDSSLDELINEVFPRENSNGSAAIRETAAILVAIQTLLDGPGPGSRSSSLLIDSLISMLATRNMPASLASADPSIEEIYAALAKPGLAAATIAALPTFHYCQRPGNESEKCIVCLTPFVAEELLKTLPSCMHSYHVECIDTWLQSRATCPICRRQV